ncbi:MAG: S8 family serine peptidase [Cyanobacteria bacterium J06639_1]
MDAETQATLVDDDDSGGGTDSQIIFTVQPGMSYLVGATSFAAGSTGIYTLSTESSGEEPDLISVPGSLSAALNPSDRRFESSKFADTYRLEGVQAGQVLTLSTTSDAIDTLLVLESDAGEVDRNDDINRDTTNSQIVFTAQPDTTYRVTVTSFGDDETGAYALSATSELAPPTPTPTPQPISTPTPRVTPSLPPRTGPLRPNDSRYGEQYGLEIIGMPEVWGSSNVGINPVVVAVVDDGIFGGFNPDLPAKSPNNARLQTLIDANRFPTGQTNDAVGVDAANTPFLGSSFAGFGNNPAFHGTHVAGIIAANTNNSEGVAGTIWSGDTNRPLPVELVAIDTFQYLPVFNDKEFTTLTSDWSDAIRYAAGQTTTRLGSGLSPRADVINLSLGGAGGCSQTAQGAIDAARAAGSVVVVAAGNASTSAPQDPASCNNVITVGATNQFIELTEFSNFGFNTLSAPGDGILSTLQGSPFFDFKSGTSMATPYVSGAVAMLRALDPSLSPDQIRSLLTANVTPSNNPRMGAGILNVARAYAAAAGTSFPGSVRLDVAEDVAERRSSTGRGQFDRDAAFVPGHILVQFATLDRLESLVTELLGDRARIDRLPLDTDRPVLIRLEGLAEASEAEAREQTLAAIEILLASSEVVFAEPNFVMEAR